MRSKRGDFDRPFESRRQRLLDLMGTFMGKPIAVHAVPSLPEDYELDQEEPSNEDIAEAVA
jgi:hypothetical protein